MALFAADCKCRWRAGPQSLEVRTLRATQRLGPSLAPNLGVRALFAARARTWREVPHPTSVLRQPAGDAAADDAAKDRRHPRNTHGCLSAVFGENGVAQAARRVNRGVGDREGHDVYGSERRPDRHRGDARRARLEIAPMTTNARKALSRVSISTTEIRPTFSIDSTP